MFFDTVNIGQASIHMVSFKKAVDAITVMAAGRDSRMVVTPNADHIVRMEGDKAYAALCRRADLVLADGMPLVWGSRLLGKPLPERVCGADLMPALCEQAAVSGLRVFLLGGHRGEAEKAAEKLKSLYPGLVIAGTYYPAFGFDSDDQESVKIVSFINSSNADLVFVGVGSPKQERWIAKYQSEFHCGVLMGVGIAISFMAGGVRRAPRFLQKMGLEWLFRLSQEPRRLFRRYLRDFYIFAIILRQVFS